MNVSRRLAFLPTWLWCCVLFGWSCLFTACPIPVARTAVIRPNLEFQVQDLKGRPVPHRQIVLYWQAHPHRRHIKTTTHRTDAKGRLILRQQTRREWVMPLMMHGVPFYYWNYCIEGPGYQLSYGSIRSTKFGQVHRLRPRLQTTSGHPRCPRQRTHIRRLHIQETRQRDTIEGPAHIKRMP